MMKRLLAVATLLLVLPGLAAAQGHAGPELKAFTNLQFSHTETKVTLMPGGQSAYATSRYTIKAKMGERELDSDGLETLALTKMPDGSWKIRHSHTSSRARRPAQ